MVEEFKYREIHEMKYMLVKPVEFKTRIRGYYTQTNYIRLAEDGSLLIIPGYLSDGPSGCTIDTPSSIPAAFGHDALYELIQRKKIPLSCKDGADEFLYSQLQKDGMNPVRALIWYRAVEAFGYSSCAPGSQDDKIRTIKVHL